MYYSSLFYVSMCSYYFYIEPFIMKTPMTSSSQVFSSLALHPRKFLTSCEAVLPHDDRMFAQTVVRTRVVFAFMTNTCYPWHCVLDAQIIYIVYGWTMIVSKSFPSRWRSYRLDHYHRAYAVVWLVDSCRYPSWLDCHVLLLSSSLSTGLFFVFIFVY